ncbi:hypothetical protein AYM40_08895 [Paraburkholderia phytofirmans OLGA172]|uniref:OTU domain-containing protein n=1 Tax=Paraburkholderia phytofirmans OLGA172 TaxID=1417228 RepID=A0A160FJK5_9BURK|nr:cytotoxic necrotizing factor Rho-activating domain-containing protein [Paraburkholderia phytofirmans]ANB72465.1 hypothetical protein AYM40_08895 [Paraburkholderia phytofirmans OLGA172]
MRSYTEDERVDGRQNAGTKKRTRKRARKRTRTGNRAIRVADLIGQDGAWNFDEFDAVPYLITQIPGWAGSGLALEVEANGIPTQRFGGDGGDAIRVRLRNNGLRDAHYSAVVNGTEVPVRDDGNCFFYAVWEALQDHRHEAAAHRIFNGREPLTRLEAARYFRRAIREYVIQNPERFNEITGSLTGADEAEEVFFDAPEHAEWLPEPVSQMASASTRNRAASTELSRTLFHLGNQATDWIGQSALTRILFQQLSAFSPVLSFYASYAVSAYRLVTALIRRDVLDGLMQTLLMLPYQLLSPPMCLLAIAEQTKRYIDSVLGWDDIQSLDADDKDQRETIYMCVGIVALITQYLYFKRTKIAFPETELGKKLVGMFGLLKRATQGYAVLQTLVDTVPVPSTTEPNAVVDPNALGYDPHDYRVQKSAAEKQWQRRHARIQKRLAIVERQEQLAEIRSRASKAAGGASNGDTGTPAPARSGAADAAVSKPLIVAGAVAASHTVVNMGAGAADVVERSALLADQEIAAVATTSRVQSLVRKSPLAGGVVGAAAAAGYGLYRLVIWLEQVYGAQDPVPDVNAGMASQAVASGNQTNSSYGRTEYTSQKSPHPDLTQPPLNELAQVTDGVSQTIHEPWPFDTLPDEMVNDFVVKLTQADADFLAVGQPGGTDAAELSPEEMDFVLHTSEEWMADGAEAEPSSLQRQRRSADADERSSRVTRVTHELDSWISSNWPVSDSFHPDSEDEMTRAGEGVYRAGNGNAYLLVGGGYWKFEDQGLVFGKLVNEKSGGSFTLQRSSPNFIWGFGKGDRAALNLGPIPDVDIPKPAVISASLISQVEKDWAGEGAGTTPRGGFRFLDGLFQDRERNLFLVVNNIYWPFRFMADKTMGEICHGTKGCLNVLFDGGEWCAQSETIERLPAKEHVIDGLFLYAVYSDSVQNNLKKIIKTIMLDRVEIRYSDFLNAVRIQLEAWFEKESQAAFSPEIPEIMLAKSEIENRIHGVKYQGRRDWREVPRPALEYYNEEIRDALVNDYQNSLSSERVDKDLFTEALLDQEAGTRFLLVRKDISRKIVKIDVKARILREEIIAMAGKMQTTAAELQSAQTLSDFINDSSADMNVLLPESFILKSSLENKIVQYRKLHWDLGLRRSGKSIELGELGHQRERLKKELRDYDSSVQVEEEKFLAYQKGIVSAILGIGSIFFKARPANDVDSQLRASRIAYLSVLFNQSSQQLRLAGVERVAYSREELKQLHASDAAMHYLHEILPTLQEYIALQHSLPLEKIREIPLRHDYRDILAAQIETARFYLSKVEGRTDEIPEEAALAAYFEKLESHAVADGWFVRTAAFIYRKIECPESAVEPGRFHPDQVILKFLTDKSKMGPFGSLGMQPDGYVPFAGFKDSKNFLTQREFTDQFADYVDKYSKYESAVVSTSMMISSGLSLLQMYGNFVEFYRFDFQDVRTLSKVAGGLSFVKLHNGDWLMVACLTGAVMVKYIEDREMASNLYLNEIRTDPYRRRYMGGKELFNIYDYNFNMPFKGPKITSDRDVMRWDDLRKILIIPLFGNNTALNNPNRPLRLVAFKSKIDREVSGLLLDEIKKYVNENIDEMAVAAKNTLYIPSFWQKLAIMFVPFYGEIYTSETDRKYSPNISQLIFDSLTVFAALGSMILSGVAVTKNLFDQIANAVWAARAGGLTGSALVKSVLTRLPGLGLMALKESMRIVAWGLYDLLEPVPLKSLAGPVLKGLLKPSKLRPGRGLNEFADAVFVPPARTFGAGGGINKVWRADNIKLNDLIEGSGPLDRGVYRAQTSANPAPQDSFGYVEIDSMVYRVDWDNYAGTWRVMDPDHPGQLGHGIPVRRSQDNRWIKHDGLPAQGASSSLVDAGKNVELKGGDISPLAGKGVLFGKITRTPDVEFTFVRNDAVTDTTATPARKFSMAEVTDENGALHGVIETWSGEQVTSKARNGPALGLWGDKFSLDADFSVMEVSNGKSGTVGISIPFDQLREGKPIVISSGELTGCSMIYAVDDNKFYAYHAGQSPGDSKWLTGKHGAASIYKAHLSLTGKSLPDVQIAPGNIRDKNGMVRLDCDELLDNAGTSLRGNDVLVDMISTYHKGTINYFGKYIPGEVDAMVTNAKANVNSFDYNKIKSDPYGSRVGIAYALLVKKSGRVKVATYSEDMSILMKNGEINYNVLDNSEYVLNDFEEDFNARTFEPARSIDVSTIPRGENVERIKEILDLLLKYSTEITGSVRRSSNGFKGSVRRLSDLFEGGKKSEFANNFNPVGIPQEAVEKLEELRNLVSEGSVSTYVRAMNYWENAGAMSERYFVFILDLTNLKFVIDATAGQLSAHPIAGPLVESEEDWVIRYQKALENTTVTIKYKDFATYEEALEFSPAYPVEARTFIDNAILLREADWYRQERASPGDVSPALAIQGDFGPEPTESGVEDAPAAVDDMPHAFTGVLGADQASLTLSWTAPANRPVAYYLYRGHTQLATLPGDATSYVDNEFGEITNGNYASYYVLVTKRVLTMIPVHVKLTYLRPDSDLASGLIHFFSFDDGLADVIVPGVSVQPFDIASEAFHTQVADRFRGQAMQVTSQNINEGALNGMKLADDISTHPQFSIGFWFNSNGVQNDSPVLGNKDWASVQNAGFMVSHLRNGMFQFNIGDGSKGVDKVIGFLDTGWVYVAMTVDTGARMATAYVFDPVDGLRTVKLSLVGIDVEKIRGVYSTIGFNEDARGDYYSRGQGVPGTMVYDEVAMWNRVLTEQEVLSLSTPTRSLSVSQPGPDEVVFVNRPRL